MPRLIRLAGWPTQIGSIIFIHGLDGHAYGTWTWKRSRFWPPSNLWNRKTEAGRFWPVWLSKDLPGFTTYSLSYDAPTFNWLGTAMPLQDRARSLLDLLIAEPALFNGPIYLVCHSLGGLLAKQILREANDRKDRRAEAASLLNQVRKVVFIATPHTGSTYASFLDTIRLVAWPSASSRLLVSNDPALLNLNVWYRNWFSSRGISNFVFFETRQTAIGQIVTAASADPGLFDADPSPLDADHSQSCKASDSSSDLYLKTLHFLRPKEDLNNPVMQLHDFVEYPRVSIERQIPTNVGPLAFRLALVLLIGFIAYKGIQSIVGARPDSLSSREMLERIEITAGEKATLAAEVKRIEKTYEINESAIAGLLAFFMMSMPLALDQINTEWSFRNLQTVIRRCLQRSNRTQACPPNSNG